MKVTVNGTKLTVEIDLVEKPEPSSSGKTLIAASTGGFTKTGVQYKGKDLSLNLTATIKP